MIEIKNISKKFGVETILKDISFKINPNQTTIILGPSGGGKSTLLRCIKFLDIPNQGHIYVDEQKITSDTDPLLFKVGLVFQNFNLFPHLSVTENLTYAASFLPNSSRQEVFDMAKELLTQFGLLNKSSFKPKSLSGGQKQRVAIARALMMRPEILLFDEPTSALDQESTFELIKFLQKLGQKMSLLIVTHDIKFAKMLADRVIFVDRGLVLCDQPADEFFSKPDSYRAKLFMEQNIL